MTQFDKPVYIIDAADYEAQQKETIRRQYLIDVLKRFVPKECQYCKNSRQNMVNGFCDNSCKAYNLKHFKLDEEYIISLYKV